MIPASPPADHAALIERDRAALVDLLEGLGEDEWKAGTVCPGWSVLDLAVHLVGDDLGVLARDRDGYFGTRPPASVESEAAFVTFIDELNDEWIRAGRRMSPQLTIELLQWAGRQLVSLYRNQDPTSRTGRVSWASDQPVPKWLDQGRELTERWVHHQQIRHAAGYATALETELLGAVLEIFSWAFPFRLSAAPRPEGVAVQVEITGVVETVWRFTAGKNGWSRSQDLEAGDPVVDLVMDADTAWRLLTNGLPPDAYPEPTKDDDDELVRILLRTRAIIGLPQP